MREKDRNYVLSNLDKLVVKPANESGGYGIMVGPHSTETHKKFAQLIEKSAELYRSANAFFIYGANLCGWLYSAAPFRSAALHSAE